MKTYKKTDTILIPKESPSEMARDWQGGNKYPGIDSYSDLTLKKGKKIVQLAAPDEIKSPAMNSSGYYVLYKDYLRLGKNAAEFCNALQVGAWENPDTKECSFRPAVNVFEVTENVQVAFGRPTLANGQYGDGGVNQIFIAGFQEKFSFLKHLWHEPLTDTSVDIDFHNLQQKKLDQVNLKRDLCCSLHQKADLFELRASTKDKHIIKTCSFHLNAINNKIKKLKNDIFFSEYKYGSILSNYKHNIKYLEEKIQNLSTGKEFSESPEREREIEAVTQNVHSKVADTVEKIHRGKMQVGDRNKEINFDNLRESYESGRQVNILKTEAEIESAKKQAASIQNSIHNLKIAAMSENGRLNKLLEMKKAANMHAGLAREYDSRKLTRKSFYRKHRSQLDSYYEATDYLKAENTGGFGQAIDRQKTKTEQAQARYQSAERQLKGLNRAIPGLEQKNRHEKQRQKSFSRLAGMIDRNTGPAKTNTPQMSM